MWFCDLFITKANCNNDTFEIIKPQQSLFRPGSYPISDKTDSNGSSVVKTFYYTKYVPDLSNESTASVAQNEEKEALSQKLEILREPI